MARSSFKERNKAVREAWNREQELVKEGKGTREWTPEQQRDILEKGRAYDDDGKAFEGQHMKSAEQYPEYQGDPGNIQFLTRSEHLEAHDGNWQNPTNWYFNPETKEKFDFGDGPYIPCDVFELAEPVIELKVIPNEAKQEVESEHKIKEKNADISHTTEKTQTKHSNIANTPRPEAGKSLKTQMKKLGKAIVEFPVKHPTAIKVAKKIGAAAVVLVAGAVAESARKGASNSGGEHSGNSGDYDYDGYIPDEPMDDFSSSDAEIEERTYTPNDVPAGKQRYHYKDGTVKWKDKPSYHRGKNEDE